MRQRLIEQYAPLIERFLDGIKGVDASGIAAPHIPIMGRNYELAKYKIAFVGIETYGWTDMNEFCELARKDSCAAVTHEEDTINSLEHLGWNKVFWGFILKFLAHFYKTDYEELINPHNNSDLLTSFVWGNTNSIEKYCVSAEPNNVEYAVWESVKNASICFDSINNLIKSVSPKLIVVLNREVEKGQKDYIESDEAIRQWGVPIKNRKKTLGFEIDDNLKIYYYYLREDNTHVISLPHPRWMKQGSPVHSIEVYVDKVIECIQRYQIWDTMPTKFEDWKGSVQDVDKSSMEFKRTFIAELADTLMRNNIVMSGKDLQSIFNMNNIRKNGGGNYSSNGGQGIHRVIANVWHYYYTKQDYQTAYNIARAFVNQNGEYAYE